MTEARRQHGASRHGTYVSVDVLALRLVAGEVRYATIERDAEPYAGWSALPGVLLLEGERLAEAGGRALQTKAGLVAAAVGQLAVFDEPSRDPRGASLSAALWAVIPEGASDLASWRGFDDPLPASPDADRPAQRRHGTLAFDHDDIVLRCRPLLARMLWNDVELTRALMGETFSVGDALGATGSLQGSAPDRGNLNKKLASVPGLVRAGHGAGRGRPSLWRWEA